MPTDLSVTFEIPAIVLVLRMVIIILWAPDGIVMPSLFRCKRIPPGRWNSFTPGIKAIESSLDYTLVC
jgi:hypothetical protein